MNMQNVSNLAIPEGQVRTIHDKDNRLLWGRVAYGVTYKGDTFQQAYSGKNLFGAQDATITSKGVEQTLSDYNHLVLYGTASENYPITRSLFATFYNPLPAGTYTLTLYGKMEGTTSKGINIFLYRQDGTEIQSLGNVVELNSPRTFTVNEPVYSMTWNRNMLTGITIDFDIRFELEQGSSAPTSYEPYTGGIPAPSPSYPMPISVVTGQQTVTIDDGVDSEAYPISLGSIELCKIGTYQDYIYKSGDDWYVHKACGKYTFTGNESLGNASEGGTGYQGYYIGKSYYSDILVQKDAPCLMEKFIQRAYAKPTSAVCFMVNSSANIVWIVKNTVTQADLKSILSGSRFYYPLATATDTKITDATLVGQLNAVHEWMTRYGYNATVTGNLPIIIDRTNL